MHWASLRRLFPHNSKRTLKCAVTVSSEDEVPRHAPSVYDNRVPFHVVRDGIACHSDHRHSGFTVSVFDCVLAV